MEIIIDLPIGFPINNIISLIEQLVPTIEQHYRSLIRRFVGAASCLKLRDGAIHGGPTLARGVDGFLR